MSANRFVIDAEVKGIVEWHLRHYAEDKRRLKVLKLDKVPSGVAGYDAAASHGGGAQRTTENVAIRIESDAMVQELERSIAAVDRVLSKADRIDVRLIDLVYRKKKYSVTGAGMVVGLSTSAAYARINAVLSALAVELGYTSGVRRSKTGKK